MRRLVVAVLAVLPLASFGGARGGCCGPSYQAGMHWLPDNMHVVFIEGGSPTYGSLQESALSGNATEQTLVRSVESAAPSPDGTRVAAIVAPGGSSDASLVIAPIGGTPQQVIGPANTFVPAWAPDGRSLVFENDAGLQLLDVASAVTRRLGRAADRASWAPDGSAVVASSDTGLVRLGIDGTQRVLDAAKVSEATWSPGGDWIAYSKAGTVWLVRSDGSSAHELHAAAASPAWSPDGKRLAALLTDRGDIGARKFPWSLDRGELALLALDGTAVGLGALAGQMYAWSPDGSWIAFSADTGYGLGIELIHPDGAGHRSVGYGCVRGAAPPLTGCSYFGGHTVPLTHARLPLHIRLNHVPSRTAAVGLQLALRDAHNYRVRVAAVKAVVSPSGAATVRNLPPVTSADGVAPFDLVPHGRLPKDFRLILTVTDAGGHALAISIFRCSDLNLPKFRGC